MFESSKERLKPSHVAMRDEPLLTHVLFDRVTRLAPRNAIGKNSGIRWETMTTRRQSFPVRPIRRDSTVAPWHPDGASLYVYLPNNFSPAFGGVFSTGII